MKNQIKLFLALTLATTIFHSTLSATAKETRSATTEAVASFLVDDKEVEIVDPENPGEIIVPPLPPVTAGSLSLASVPQVFHFGSHGISAANLHGVQRFGVDTDLMTGGRLNEFVAVWDGRVLENDWTLSVSATPFTSGKDVLKGATIEIQNVRKTNTDTVAGRSTVEDLTKGNMAITTDGVATAILTANPIAKAQSNLHWDMKDVALLVEGSELTFGSFGSTLTWTLQGTPES